MADDDKKPSDDKKSDDKSDDKGKVPKKLELTEDELTERTATAVREALAEADRKRADKDAKDKEESERKKAEEQGEYQKLSEAAEKKRLAAEQERDAAKLDKRRLEVKDRLRDYLSEKHPAYAAAAKWIIPAVEFDLSTDDKEIDKRISSAADAYVKDNPRQAGGGGAPGHIGKGNRAVEGEKAKDDKSNNEQRPLSRTARMAF